MQLKTSEGDTPNINRIPSTTNSIRKTFLGSFKEKHDAHNDMPTTKIKMKPLSNMRNEGISNTTSPQK